MNHIKTSKYKLPLLILLVLIIGIVGLEVAGVTNFYHKDNGKITPQPGLTQEETKQQSDINLENKKRSAEQTADATPTSAKNIELTAKKETNGTVTVFTKLFGYTAGSCNLKITNGSKSSSQQAEVVYQPQYSSCAGFSVPIADLSNGDWNIVLSVTSGGQTTDKSLSYKVQ
jgi:hypothetical protein